MGLNYHRLFDYVRALGISQYYHVEVNNGEILVKANAVNK